MFTAYAAAKTALIRFTETLAIETAGDRIRVTRVASGAFASGTTKVVHSSAENARVAEAAAARQLLDRGIQQMRRRRPGSAKAAM
jgi:NAD(P)-dependent dehydrogenase (short-subunit alcohol dehydrogenase family)